MPQHFIPFCGVIGVEKRAQCARRRTPPLFDAMSPGKRFG
jgi:hypothetical protein